MGTANQKLKHSFCKKLIIIIIIIIFRKRATLTSRVPTALILIVFEITLRSRKCLFYD